ncbi:Tetratricopeptide-like helical [Ceraceosorus bombacis]|uniref:Tetratricopeptide-like helical n=1 Tax=Ceraceosorus bombacis TaxID=401625 RepID=A0A0P1BMG9_9BASI|nr:Tetratricopeptide-like helical [Ceraceosorus bombacis]
MIVARSALRAVPAASNTVKAAVPSMALAKRHAVAAQTSQSMTCVCTWSTRHASTSTSTSSGQNGDAASNSSTKSKGTHAPASSSASSSSDAPRKPFVAPPPPGSSSFHVRTLFRALVGAGILATGYGLYEYYAMFQTWPKEIRGTLRSAVKLHRQGEARRAEVAYRSALALALKMEGGELGKDANLKISGISIALGSLLEEHEQLVAAYDVYNDALTRLRDESTGATSGPERMRAVAIAQRLGDLASTTEVSAAAGVTLSELELPAWVQASELGASLEALATLYANRGRAEYAAPLYLQAISLLLPPAEQRKRNATAAERCRAAVMMSNLSLIFLQAAPKGAAGDEGRTQGKSWAEKGLSIVEKTNAMAGWAGEKAKAKVEGGQDEDRVRQVRAECASAETTLLFNLGYMSELASDPCQARKYFQRAYKRADDNGLREARSHAAEALSRLERSGSLS